MIIGERIRARLAHLGMSQSELARRVNLTQGTIGGLIIGKSRSSTHLHRIARALGTTPSYLSGETDDPEEDAPPPPSPPAPRFVMEVVFPAERALARMFSGLLKGIDRAASVDEQALLLARRLPIALSQLRDLEPEPTTAPAARQAPAKAPAVPAMRDREPTR